MLTTDYNWPPLSLDLEHQTKQVFTQNEWHRHKNKFLPSLEKCLMHHRIRERRGSRYLPDNSDRKVFEMALTLKYFILVGKIIGIVF